MATPLATTAFSLLTFEQKQEMSERYRQAIKDTVASGKTVVTANLSMLEEADVIIYNESPEQTVERTSSSERSNPYTNEEYAEQSHTKILENIKGKESYALKANQFAAHILLTNPNFKYFEERVRKEYQDVNEAVAKFLDNFGFTIDEFTDAGYSIDYLERTIHAVGSEHITEAAGELIAFMMQYNGFEKEIIARMAVEKGLVKQEELFHNGKIYTPAYKSIDKSELFKIIGRSIAKELNYQFGRIKQGKHFDNTKPKENLLVKIREIVKTFLHKIFDDDLQETVEKLAVFSRYVTSNILQNNEAMVKGSILKPGDENAGIVQKVDLEKAFKEHPYEANIIKILSDEGIVLTGSAAMATQGQVLRPKENPLHDLDFETSGFMTRQQLEDKLFKHFDNIQHIRSITNEEYVTQTYLILNRPFSVEKLDNDSPVYQIKDANTGKQLGYFENSNLFLNKGVQGKFLDFFTE